MRTTLELDSELMLAAKRLAAVEGRTLTSVVEDALRALLARVGTPVAPVSLPTFGGDGVQAGVNLANWASVQAVLNEHDDAAVRSAIADAAS